MKNYLRTITGKKVVVTGGLGFVGHNLVKKLVNEYQCDVTVVDDCSNSSPAVMNEIKDRVKINIISILDDKNFFPLLDDAQYIFHLACIQIGLATSQPFLDLHVNGEGTLKILDYLQQNRSEKLERILYTSSASVYGSNTKLPLEEDDPKNVLSHYAASKLLGENYMNVYNVTFDLPVTIVRYSNVYGYGQSPRNPYCGVLGKFVHNALTGAPLKVFGDGEQTRDYTFIEDALTATILAAVHPKGLGETYNIGTSVETSVNKLVDLIGAMGISSSVEYVPERDIDNIRRRVISVSKIQKELGWYPGYNINKGLDETIKWYKTTL
ncbi:MAG TPA: NAD-dependent epimerase/dehydratase family protein [Ignavibacteriaceae bacterium]|jgi:UDP-glucose 4-epimerase|nr:NAD-dependent epimerase/dehydratase family protein [Ignavibacteriaceae bacterium]HOJ18162.1 NAD-dependent epimerase/dehydratase family protein [Ignavibacteriaceae bacterium]